MTDVTHVLTLECEHGVTFAGLLLPISQQSVQEFLTEAPTVYGGTTADVHAISEYVELSPCPICLESGGD